MDTIYQLVGARHRSAVWKLDNDVRSPFGSRYRAESLLRHRR